jgi:hypothetical protein
MLRTIKARKIADSKFYFSSTRRLECMTVPSCLLVVTYGTKFLTCTRRASNSHALSTQQNILNNEKEVRVT